MLAVLDLGIDLNVWPWIWLGVAVVFAILELTVVAGSFIVLPWAGSAFVTAILAFYRVPIELQWAVFVIGGSMLFYVLYRWSQRFQNENTIAPGVGAHRLVGLSAVVVVPIVPGDARRSGRVSIEGEVWGALSDVVRTLDVGERATVRSVSGTRVIVEPVGSVPAHEQQGRT